MIPIRFRIACRCLFVTGLFVTLALVATSCAGAFGTLDFDTLKYPASTSGYLYRHTGQAASLAEMKVVGSFKHEKRFFGMFYSAVPLTGRYDIGSVINEAIRESNGHGAVNVTISVDDCGVNKVPILAYIPIWPGCAKVLVSGQVVRMKRPANRATPTEPTATAATKTGGEAP